jgi:hypothetical protein
MRTAALLVLAVLVLAAGVARWERSGRPVSAQAPKAGLLEQAAAMRSLNDWVQAGDARTATVNFSWDKASSACKVHLAEPGKAVVGEGAELPGAAKDALQKWNQK